MRNMVWALLTIGLFATPVVVTGTAESSGGGSQTAAVETSIPCAVTRPNGKGPPPQDLNHFFGSDSMAVDLLPN